MIRQFKWNAPLALIFVVFFGSHCTGFAQVFPEGSCIKYVYADLRKVNEVLVPVFACTNIVRRKAQGCLQIGSIDMKKFHQERDEALKKMWAFFQGMAAGRACKIGVTVLPLFLKPLGMGGAVGAVTGVDGVATEDKITRNARKKVLNGTRVPGTLPEPGDIKPTAVDSFCAGVKLRITGKTKPSDINGIDAYNMGFDAYLYNWTHSAAANAMLVGDRSAIEKMYPAGREREAALKEFTDRIKAEKAKQEAILATVFHKANEFYKFMQEDSEIPFGYGPDVSADDLKCIANPAKFTELKARLCQLAKSTAVVDGFKPGDLFNLPAGRVQQIENAEERARQLVKENCPNEVAGVAPAIQKSKSEIQPSPEYP